MAKTNKANHPTVSTQTTPYFKTLHTVEVTALKAWEVKMLLNDLQNLAQEDQVEFICTLIEYGAKLERR